MNELVYYQLFTIGCALVSAVAGVWFGKQFRGIADSRTIDSLRRKVDIQEAIIDAYDMDDEGLGEEWENTIPPIATSTPEDVKDGGWIVGTAQPWDSLITTTRPGGITIDTTANTGTSGSVTPPGTVVFYRGTGDEPLNFVGDGFQPN